jgi:hypothetical protein
MSTGTTSSAGGLGLGNLSTMFPWLNSGQGVSSMDQLFGLTPQAASFPQSQRWGPTTGWGTGNPLVSNYGNKANAAAQGTTAPPSMPGTPAPAQAQPAAAAPAPPVVPPPVNPAVFFSSSDRVGGSQGSESEGGGGSEVEIGGGGDSGGGGGGSDSGGGNGGGNGGG